MTTKERITGPAILMPSDTARTYQPDRLFSEDLWEHVPAPAPVAQEGEDEALSYMRAELREAAATITRLQARVAELEANPRDEYHTMRELYEYRMLYNAHAAHGWLAAGIPVVKSRRHHDGELCFGGGWFIVVATLPTGQVSNHYKDDHWSLFDVPEVELPPEYDGHTPQVAADRLLSALRGAGGTMSEELNVNWRDYDGDAAANGCDMAPAVDWHTFDIDAPELERFLCIDGHYQHRTVIGAEVICTSAKEPTR
jgi:hypothetical protein